MANVAIDIETTSLDKNIGSIIEIAIIQYDIDFRPMLGIKFISKIKPVTQYGIDPEALKVNNLTLEELNDAPTAAQVRNMFLEWKDGIFGEEKLKPLGHNYAGFDQIFLEKWLGDYYYKIFNHHSRDSVQIADIVRDLNKLDCPSLSLNALVKHFSINTGKLHRAEIDALCSLEIYRRCMFLLRQ